MEIGVLVVDDFPLVRRGIVSALRADPAIKVLGEATTCAEHLDRRIGAQR